MNKKATVTVQTPCGETSSFDTEPIVKAGTVSGPILCSSSTGEYGEENVGVCIGTVVIPSLLYVDDLVDMTSSPADCVRAHENAVLFGKKKKLKFSATKCYIMSMNNNSDVSFVLEIDGENNVVPSDKIVYLGDVFNDKGDNCDLITDRLERGTKAMFTIASLMAETDVGVHRISTMLLLYRSLFLSTMLFNSQTWSKIRKEQIDKLRTLQLKFLKRIVGVSVSTSNSFLFLELGVLPIEYEIDRRKLMYLHRILQLDNTDPVYKVFVNMQAFQKAGEENWWSGVAKALADYNLPTDLEAIRSMSKDGFRKLVNESITEIAFNCLLSECKAQKKTSNLEYTSLKLQEYLTVMYPNQSRTILKCRSKTVDLKTHLTYKYKDKACRKCGSSDEEILHVINCGHTVQVDLPEYIYIQNLEDTIASLKLFASRINEFLDEQQQ